MNGPLTSMTLTAQEGKRHKVRGLIHILSSYKFTIAENTPIEEEVALDPELLGKVFENSARRLQPRNQGEPPASRPDPTTPPVRLSTT